MEEDVFIRRLKEGKRKRDSRERETEKRRRRRRRRVSVLVFGIFSAPLYFSEAAVGPFF